MRKGSIPFENITRDKPAYSLEGMLRPMFKNTGNTPCMVYNSVIVPGGHMIFDFPFVISDTEIEIRFLPVSDPQPGIKYRNNLNVYWGTVTGEEYTPNDNC